MAGVRENNGTPGRILFLSGSYFLTQDEHTDNVSVAPSVTGPLVAFALRARLNGIYVALNWRSIESSNFHHQ
jgi:hypothetical protein